MHVRIGGSFNCFYKTLHWCVFIHVYMLQLLCYRGKEALREVIENAEMYPIRVQCNHNDSSHKIDWEVLRIRKNEERTREQMENSHGSAGAGTGVSLECLTLQIKSSFNVEKWISRAKNHRTRQAQAYCLRGTNY